MRRRILSLALAFVLTLAFVPSFAPSAQAAGTWQEAYAELLRGKTGEFTLADIDKDGTPELIARLDAPYEVYTYTGTVKKLRVVGYSYGKEDVKASVTLHDFYQDDLQRVYCDFSVYGEGRLDIGLLTIQGDVLRVDYDQPFQSRPRIDFYPIDDSTIKTHLTGNTGTPHPYATALKAFIDGAKDSVTAYLADINGDGTQEMLAKRDDSYYTFFYMYNGKLCTYSNYYENSWEEIFFSSTDYLIYLQAGDGFSYSILTLENGEVVNNLYFGNTFYETSGGVTTEYLYQDKNTPEKNITKAEYEALLKQYGTENYNDRPDQTAEILAMTAAPVADKPSSWAETQVSAAIAANLIPPSLQSQYTESTTRAEFCALAVALYEKQKGVITGRTAFTDTNDVNVQKAASIGIVSGVGNNKFSPDTQLTREQAAVMLTKLSDAIGKPLPKKATTFADKGSMASWSVDAVGQIQAAGIMSGIGDNKFAPQNPYTREQSIITIMKLYDALK